MPITEELKTAQELRAAGAAPALAELLAAKLEGVAVATRDAAFRDILVEIKALRGDMNAEFKSVRADMAAEFKALRADMNAEFKALRADIDLRFARVDVRFAETHARIAEADARSAETRAALETSMRVWMAAMIAALGVAVAIIKLFPNWY